MLIIPKIPFRRRRQPATQTAPPALTLVSAAYSEDGYVTLQFDRAIDIAGFEGDQVTVVDEAINATTYRATGTTTLLNPTTLRADLVTIAPAEGDVVTLSATGATGIVAADDGGTWAGVTELELPWP